MQTLSANSVTHQFGSTTVLSGVNLTVEDNEFVSLIGPSGCGKTTLLNLFAGFVRPSSGSCSDRHGPIERPSPARTVVFQEYALFPWMSVQRNVASGLEAKGLPRQQVSAQVDRWLDLVRLRAVSDRYPGQLSGGMKQRIALARAMALEPEVILMDEPFGALDLLTRESLQEEVLRIRASTSGSFVLITHSVDEAVYMSDRIVVMSHSPGRVLEEIRVDLPYPRDPSLRISNSRFADIRAHITQLIRDQGH